MKAAVLEDVEKIVAGEIPAPEAAPCEVVLLVKAVGVCGTDLHLFRSHGNYNELTPVASAGASGGFDPDKRPTPYRCSLELVSSGKISVQRFVTYWCGALDEIHNPFEHASSKRTTSKESWRSRDE